MRLFSYPDRLRRGPFGDFIDFGQQSLPKSAAELSAGRASALLLTLLHTVSDNMEGKKTGL